MFATLTDNGRFMVGMTYWRKGGEEPPRRVDEICGEGVARWICRGSGFCRGFCLSKGSFSRRKKFLRFKIRFKIRLV